MKRVPILSLAIPSLVLLVASAEKARQLPPSDYRGTVLNSDQLDRLFRTPACLEGYMPQQSGR